MSSTLAMQKICFLDTLRINLPFIRRTFERTTAGHGSSGGSAVHRPCPSVSAKNRVDWWAVVKSVDYAR